MVLQLVFAVLLVFEPLVALVSSQEFLVLPVEEVKLFSLDHVCHLLENSYQIYFLYFYL